MKKKLLLHACCAPCTSGVVWQIAEDYDITLLFYNPNIDTLEEYNRRLEALEQLVEALNQEYSYNLKLIAIPYKHEEFIPKIASLEGESEGGKRCTKCIELRLDYTAKYCRDFNFDLFASTLSVSPHKNNVLINTIGDELSVKYSVAYLPSNFKKNNGFLTSIQNSKKYNIYRQNYCGCEFAKIN